MNKVVRGVAAVCVAVLVSFGATSGAGAAPVSDAQGPPAATLAGETLWQWYEGPFKSPATCEARARVIKDIYGGTHHGAINKTKCAYGTSPLQCPAVTGTMLYVKKVVVEGGPRSVQPQVAATENTLPVAPACG